MLFNPVAGPSTSTTARFSLDEIKTEIIFPLVAFETITKLRRH